MRSLAVAAALAALVLVAGSAPAVVPPASVTVRAASGQVYEGYVIAPGEVHSFLLEDFAPMPVSIALKAGKGSTLLPDIALYDPAELDVTPSLAAFRKDGAKSVAVKNATGITLPGRYVLQVKGKTGSTGSYLLKVTAKVIKAFKGSGLVNSPSTATFGFLAPTESLVTVKVVPGSGSILVADYEGVEAPPCSAATLLPSTKPGQATFAAPLTGDYDIEISGNGGTGGAFHWSAKIKTVKPSKKPVRVNGGAPFFALPGPSGGILTAKPGQTVAGFDAGPAGLCWREVRTTGGGPNGGKNSVQAATLKGGGLPALGNNLFTDLAPLAGGFAAGPTHAALFDYTAGVLYGIPREGGGEVELNDTLGTTLRLLVEGDSVFHLRSDGIRRYAFDQSIATGVSTDGSYTYIDMAVGGAGIVFAATDGSGDLVIATVDRDGGSFAPLATLSPAPDFHALAARGTDAFLAVDNGDGGAEIYRISSCFPGEAVPLCPDFTGPVRAMAADDQNAYAIEDDAEDGIRLRQIPRSGGESVVIFRGPDETFNIQDVGVAAAGGYAYVLADDGSGEAFWRVKRR